MNSFLKLSLVFSLLGPSLVFAQQRCEMIFSSPGNVIEDLAHLRVDIENASEKSFAATLMKQFNRKVRAAEKAGLNLSELPQKIKDVRATQASVDAERKSKESRLKKEEDKFLKHYHQVGSLKTNETLREARISPDGRWIFGTVLTPGSNKLLFDGAYLGSQPRTDLTPGPFEFTPDGKQIIVNTVDSKMNRYFVLADLETNAKVRLFDNPVPGISMTNKVSPDGKFLFGISYMTGNSEVFMWDLAAKKRLHTWGSDNKLYFHRVFFSGDASRFAATNADRTEVVVYNTVGLTEIARWKVHFLADKAVFLNRDGSKILINSLATNNRDREILLGDNSTQQLQTLPIHGQIHGWSSDEKKILLQRKSSDGMERVLIYNVEHDHDEVVSTSQDAFIDATLSPDASQIIVFETAAKNKIFRLVEGP
jgi:Tol biopolymer transport system component